MAHEMIHGGGSDYNTGNRWFDKTMQVYYSSKKLNEKKNICFRSNR